MKSPISLQWPLAQVQSRVSHSHPVLSGDESIIDACAGHGRQNSLQTGMQIATRGRRDMSSRVHDVVLGLALCHNVSTKTSVAV